ncbi:MAG: hypothetical protein ACYCUV_06880, partial [Phycisphaerae bacterium]
PWWATNNWWDAPEYAKTMRDNEAQFRVALDAMRHHFGRSWWTEVFESQKPNFVTAHLIGQGTMVLDFIRGLGSALASLESSQGIATKIQALKEDESGATFLEIEIAAVLRAAGLEIAFPATTNARKTYDILAQYQAQPVAIECKNLEIEEWEKWTMDLGMRVLRALPVGTDQRFNIQVNLDPHLSQIRTDEKNCPGLNAAIAAEIIDRIRVATEEAIAENPDLPFEFSVEGLGTAVLRDAKENSQNSITTTEISLIAQLRHLLTNGLYRAIGQLPKDGPGIIVIHCEHMPDLNLARIVLEAATKCDPDRLGRLSALVLIPRRYLNDHRPGLLFSNRHAAYHTSASERAISVLQEELGLVAG